MKINISCLPRRHKKYIQSTHFPYPITKIHNTAYQFVRGEKLFLSMKQSMVRVKLCSKLVKSNKAPGQSILNNYTKNSTSIAAFRTWMRKCARNDRTSWSNQLSVNFITHKHQGKCYDSHWKFFVVILAPAENKKKSLDSSRINCTGMTLLKFIFKKVI